jgi:DNA polymerase elongation subunit (family B)
MLKLPIPKGRQYTAGWCNGEDVCLAYRDEKGVRHVQQFEFPWYFYVRTSDLVEHEDVFDSIKQKGLIRKLERYVMDKEFTRVYCENRNLSRRKLALGQIDAKKQIAMALDDAKIETFEADLTSLKRLMVDHEILIASRYKVIYLDIETQDQSEDGKKLPLKVGAYPILSCSIELANGKQYFICHRSELRVLHNIKEFLEKTDAVVTFYGKEFDWPYIQERFKQHDIYFDWRQVHHIDIHELLYELHKADQDVEQYSLDYLAKAFLGEGKVEHPGKSIYRLWCDYLSGKSKTLEEYNKQDTRLTRLLSEKKKLISFVIQVCRMTSCFLSEYRKSWLIDAAILRQAMLTGRPVPTKRYHSKMKKLDGAFVFDPIPGRYENVAVYDYTALYPNIIRSWNIGTVGDTMFDRSAIKKSEGAKFSTSCQPYDDVVFSQDRPSMLSIVVDIFLEGRAKVQAEMKVLEKEGKGDTPEYWDLDLIQQAWKILANSTYGVCAYPNFRFYDKRIAESITHGGRVMLDMAREWFEANG